MTNQVNKYYNGSLNFAQKTTEQDVVNGRNLGGKHIENLCSGFLTNAIYANIIEIGSDVDRRGNIHTGSILIEEMTIAGQ